MTKTDKSQNGQILQEMRPLLLTVRRALLMISKAIEKCYPDDFPNA